MRRIPSLLALTVIGLLVVASVASCGEATEKLTEEAIEQSAGGGEVDIDDDGSVSFENDEGSFSVDDEGNVDIESEDGSYSVDSNTGGDLPDDFPDVPLPDGFEPQSNSQQSSGDQTSYTVFGLADGDAEQVFADVIDQYEADGYETEGKYENTTAGDFNGGAQFAGSDYDVSLSVFGADGETNVSLTVVPASSE